MEAVLRTLHSTVKLHSAGMKVMPTYTSVRLMVRFVVVVVVIVMVALVVVVAILTDLVSFYRCPLGYFLVQQSTPLVLS